MGLLFDNTGNLNWSNNRNNGLPYVYDINITNPNIVIWRHFKHNP